MSSNSVCNHTHDYANRTPATRSSDFVNHSYDYRPNWTLLSPVTITYYSYINLKRPDGKLLMLEIFKSLKNLKVVTVRQ